MGFGILKDFCKPLTMFTILLVKIEAFFQNADNVILVVYIRKLLGKPGVTSQFPAQ
jgi:hypothetical protein